LSFTGKIVIAKSIRKVVIEEWLAVSSSLQVTQPITTFLKRVDVDTIENVGKNGQTLKVLNLGSVHLRNVGNPTKAIQKLFKSCVELNELNFGYLKVQELSLSQQGELVTAMVNNLTPKIWKVDLGFRYNLKDKHVKLLVERCNRITELTLSFSSITKDSEDKGQIISKTNSTVFI
jgi:hypothetical protein